ncbi:MAG: amine oxidoreductase, partial [Lachnospiraceae bacterium]|nr:amine oxidoreductase [Lachnospiraceae bacterium]
SYFVNDYAYPLNTIGKQEKVKEFLDFTATRNIIGLGRWGQWQHFNSDVVMRLAMDLAGKMLV